MRAVVQRVSEARVTIDGEVRSQIGRGFLVLLGIERNDTERDADYLAHRIAGLRLFPDDEYKMNLSVNDVGGSVLIVSQFTLYGDCRKGMRPSYDRAARPEAAQPLYDYFVERMRATGLAVETGVFQAMMQVALVNDGPVTLICESVGGGHR
jgi:D-tyrosyl-tRNA(Tyr) deacylase